MQSRHAACRDAPAWPRLPSKPSRTLPPSPAAPVAPQVLSTVNEEQTVDLAQMGRTRSSRGVVALDVSDARLEMGVQVEIIDGGFRGRTGTVKHIFKAYVFVHTQGEKAHSGIACARARQCRLLGGAVQQMYEGFAGDVDTAPTAAPTFVPQSPGAA